jgi:tRNA pseudouridine38-40 synthase
MPRYKLTIAYDGSDFHGWQHQQRPGEEPLRTVQLVVEQAVRHVVREPIILMGASRTDSGVHARGQVAAFTSDQEIPPERIVPAINSRLPDDVQIRAAEFASPEFDPIKDATSKWYRYRLKHGKRGRVRPPLFNRKLVTFVQRVLDAERMQRAAQHLVGTHDFASLSKRDHGRETTIRTIHRCSVTATSRHRLHIDVEGDGFLYNMVRIIAGTLVEIGYGKRDADDIPAILEARDRDAAGPTLPPNGLCLMCIHYDS